MNDVTFKFKFKYEIKFKYETSFCCFLNKLSLGYTLACIQFQKQKLNLRIFCGKQVPGMKTSA